MSHKRGHIIIERVPSTPPTGGEAHEDVVTSVRVELNFAPTATLEQRVKKVRQVERALEKLEHDEEAADGG